MNRDLAALTGRTFDVLVVGGGIYGLTIAYDAAQRGLSVALVERDDFGSGASFNHLRTIHGGLRYLQTLDLARSRESMRERRTFATIAPQAVQPMPFVLPLRPSLMQGATAMRAGFVLDRLVAFDRNRGVPMSHRLPPGRVLSGDELRRFQGLDGRGVAEAAVWYDYVTTEADRLTFAFALAASEHGAILANHFEVTALLTDGGRVAGIRGRDGLDGLDLEVRARLTVNATGGGVDQLLTPLGAATGIPMLKAMNLVTRREAGDAAVGGRTASGRPRFMVPWRGRALFGTWESSSDNSGKVDSGDADVTTFIRELNHTFSTLDLTAADVTLVHRGIVPAVMTKQGLALEGHEQIRDHAEVGGVRLEALISVVGAKFTTARGVAEQVTDLALKKLQRPFVACRTATTVLAGGGVPDLSGISIGADTLSHLAAAYGMGVSGVLSVCVDRPELLARVGGETSVIGAQLVWAARHEMVGTLTDAMVRRPLGVLGDPGGLVVDRAWICWRRAGVVD